MLAIIESYGSGIHLQLPGEHGKNPYFLPSYSQLGLCLF
jgi:hypothetical protein